MKKCSKCKIEKPLEDFHKKSDGKYGRHPHCKECRSKKRKLHYEANKETYSKKARLYRDANRETLNKKALDKYHTKLKHCEEYKEYRKEYRRKNADILKANLKTYYENNPEYYRLMNDIRRKRMKENNIVPLTKEEKRDLNAIYKICRWISKYEGEQHHVDHIIPVSKGGLHHPSNLQILTAKENLSKGNKLCRT